MPTRLTSTKESSNSVFAADWVGMWAPRHKVGNCLTGPQPLQPWFDSICPSYHVWTHFCHFKGQSSTTDCCHESHLSEEKNLKVNIVMKSRKIIVSYR